VAALGHHDRRLAQDLLARRRIGFLAQAEHLAGQLAAGTIASEKVRETQAVIANNRLDAAVTGLFMALVSSSCSTRPALWWRTLRGGPALAPRAEAVSA
jgi:hypothetical protein